MWDTSSLREVLGKTHMSKVSAPGTFLTGNLKQLDDGTCWYNISDAADKWESFPSSDLAKSPENRIERAEKTKNQGSQLGSK